MRKLYYTPPPTVIFREVKSVAIQLWKEIDTDNDRFKYATGKINRIKDLDNIDDNFMYIVAMFSINNQITLAGKINQEARVEIRNRMRDGGQPENFIVF